MTSQDLLIDAEAKVLNTSTNNILSAHKDKTFGQLVKKSGLDKKKFREEVKTDMTSSLKSQGYSSDQITIASQRLEIHHLKHHKKN